LDYHIERRLVTLQAFASFAFDKISLAALYSTTTDCFKALKLDRDVVFARCILNWRLLRYFIVVTYVLGFPTMVSVITSYQASYTPSVSRPDDHFLMRISELQTPMFVIVGGHRIRLLNNQPIYEGDLRTNILLSYT